MSPPWDRPQGWLSGRSSKASTSAANWSSWPHGVKRPPCRHGRPRTVTPVIAAFGSSAATGCSNAPRRHNTTHRCRSARCDRWGGRARSVDYRHRLDFDHKIGMRQAPYFDRRAGRRGRAEIAQAHVAALLKLLEAGDIGIGLDDVGEGGAGGLQAGLDIFPDLLDLGAHITLADTIAVRVAGELPGDEDHLPGAADRDHLGIGRLARHHPDMDPGGLNLLAFDGHAAPFLGPCPKHDPNPARARCH